MIQNIYSNYTILNIPKDLRKNTKDQAFITSSLFFEGKYRNSFARSFNQAINEAITSFTTFFNGSLEGLFVASNNLSNNQIIKEEESQNKIENDTKNQDVFQSLEETKNNPLAFQVYEEDNEYDQYTNYDEEDEDDDSHIEKSDSLDHRKEKIEFKNQKIAIDENIDIFTENYNNFINLSYMYNNDGLRILRNQFIDIFKNTLDDFSKIGISMDNLGFLVKNSSTTYYDENDSILKTNENLSMFFQDFSKKTLDTLSTNISNFFPNNYQSNKETIYNYKNNLQKIPLNNQIQEGSIIDFML